jgi:hypothetical protein
MDTPSGSSQSLTRSILKSESTTDGFTSIGICPRWAPTLGAELLAAIKALIETPLATVA